MIGAERQAGPASGPGKTDGPRKRRRSINKLQAGEHTSVGRGETGDDRSISMRFPRALGLVTLVRAAAAAAVAVTTTVADDHRDDKHDRREDHRDDKHDRREDHRDNKNSWVRHPRARVSPAALPAPSAVRQTEAAG